MKPGVEELKELLLFALPYMESAADDPCYTDRGVKACNTWCNKVKGILK